MYCKSIKKQAKKLYLALVTRKPSTKNFYLFELLGSQGSYATCLGKLFSELARSSRLASIGVTWVSPGVYLKLPR